MKKQSLLKLLLIVFMSMIGTKSFAHDIEVANAYGVIIYYDWKNNNTELGVSFRGKSEYSYSNEYCGYIVIPASVEYLGETYSVTSIGKNAFSNCLELTSVTIPSSVTSIGEKSFFGCSGLTSVTIPSSVTSIGNSAFSGCSGLTSVTIPNSVTSIDPNVFQGCSGLTSVTIPNSVTSIGNSAFSGCSGLTSVTIPNSVTSIGNSAFPNCSKLNSIKVESGNCKYDSRENCNAIIETESNTLISGCKNTIIPSSVISIGHSAFQGCSGLTSLTIPNSVTSIGTNVFQGCSGLTSVTISNSVSSIENSAFSGCSGLTSVTIPNSVTSIGNSAFSGCSGLTSITIPNSVTSIENSAFSGCSGLTSVTIPNSVTSIGNSAFPNCSKLNSIKVESGNSKYDSRENCNAIIETESNKLLSGCKNTIIPSSVTSIGLYAFSGCSGLTSIKIPNSVTSIDNGAFRQCSGLSSVVISNAVKSIGNFTFEGCQSLTDITIPNSVTFIGDLAFSDCSSLSFVIIGEGIAKIYDDAFSGCTNLTDMYCYAEEVPNAMPQFCGMSTITRTLHVPATSIELYKSNTSWARYFKTVVALKDDDPKPFGISGLCGNNVYYSYEKATSTLTISGKGDMNNYDSSNQPWQKEKIYIEKIIIEDGVSSVGTKAFYGCNRLSSIIIPNSVKSIGNFAFYGCSNLTSVIIGSGVTSIGYNAFNNISIKKTIWLTNTPPTGYNYASGAVNYVSNNQFNLDNQIEYKFLSSYFDVDGVRYVPVSPSERICDAIDCIYDESSIHINIASTVVYKGVTMTVKNIKPYLAYNNRYIRSLMVDYDGVLADYAFYNCPNIESTMLGSNISSIGKYAFYNCSSLEEINIPDAVTSIGTYAFFGCINIVSTRIGSSVSSVGAYAFSGCTSLASVNMGSGGGTIYSYAFSNCYSLKKLTIGSQVNDIRNNAFQNCLVLSTIVIPKSVSNIGNNVFYGCKGLKSVFIANREEELTLGSNSQNGSSTSNTDYNYPLFSSCPLDTVYIGGNISYKTSSNYGYSPFYRNTSLRAIRITDKETEISTNEFYGCSNLQIVRIGDGVTTIGDWAFSGCSSLKFFAFGSQVKAIGKEAFSDCTALVELTSKSITPPTCGSQALDDISKWNCTLYVPDGCLGAYEDADQWKEFLFKEEGTGTIEQDILGDVNRDGNVDAVDIVEIINAKNGNPSDNYNAQNADMDGNNDVNQADIDAIVKIIMQQ